MDAIGISGSTLYRMSFVKFESSIYENVYLLKMADDGELAMVVTLTTWATNSGVTLKVLPLVFRQKVT